MASPLAPLDRPLTRRLRCPGRHIRRQPRRGHQPQLTRRLAMAQAQHPRRRCALLGQRSVGLEAADTA